MKKKSDKKMFSGNSHNYSQVGYNDDSDDDQENDFVQRQIRQQQLQMKQQDEGLDFLSESASRLGTLSLGIHEELNSQNMMLDDMENELDKATTNLEIVTLKTKELIQKSGGKRNFMIILSMAFVVVILLFLIIYT